MYLVNYLALRYFKQLDVIMLHREFRKLEEWSKNVHDEQGL